MAEKVDQPVEEQKTDKPAKVKEKKAAKKTRQPKAPKQDDAIYLPVLAELTFTTSAVFLVFVFLAMAVVSLMTGTSLLDFVLRTSAALVVIGGLLMTVTHQVSKDVLSISKAEFEEKLNEAGSEALKNIENPFAPDQGEPTGNIDHIENLYDQETPESSVIGSESVEVPAMVEVQ